MKSQSLMWKLAGASLLIAWIGTETLGQTVVVKTTRENLIQAFQGESNAQAKYLAYAKKADEEGYGAVASLFRATARAEQIHANNHGKILEGLSAKPEVKFETIAVKTTRENLEDAIKGEKYEQEKMYPAFIEQARKDKDADAIRSFDYARTAEAAHATFYADALKNLSTLKKSEKKDYFVCKVCGYTVTKLDFEKCFSCRTPKEEYEKVS